MKKKEIHANFKFGQDALVGKGIEIRSNCNRDQTQFTARGIAAARITAFQDMINAFLAQPTDVELYGAYLEKVAIKDAAKAALVQSVQDVMGRVIQRDTVHSARYRRFGAGAVSQAKDDTLTIIGTRVNRVGTALLADYAAQNLTSTMLGTVVTNTTTLKNTMEDVHDANADRDEATNTRLISANTLYTEMAYLAGVGKSIWVSVDEAKYNDYVIYDTAAAQTHWVGNLASLELHFIVERTWVAGTMVNIRNAGATSITYGLVANEGDAITGGTTLAPFTENLVPIESLGSIANHFLKVKNEDAGVGRFDFKVV